MTLCYLGLGSNLNSPERQLRRAIATLRTLPHSQLVKVANFYRSEAWGRKAQPNYCNTVVALQTSLTPHQLLRYCRDLEYQQGRLRRVKWGARSLDIDILLFGTQKIQSPALHIPHPRLHQRDFVYMPLLEVALKPLHINGINLEELVSKNSHSSINLLKTRNNY